MSEAASAPRNCSGFLPTPSGTCFSSDSLQAQEIWSSRDSAQLLLNQFGAQQASHHPRCPAAINPVGFAARRQHSSLVPLPPPEEKLLMLLSTSSFPKSSLDFAGGEGQAHRGTFWWRMKAATRPTPAPGPRPCFHRSSDFPISYSTDTRGAFWL